MNEFKNLLNTKNITLTLFLLVLVSSLFLIFDILYPFIIAFIIAYICGPLTVRLNSYFPKIVSSLISTLTFIFLILLVFSLMLPILFFQFEKLIEMAPLFAEKIGRFLSDLKNNYSLFDQIDTNQIFSFTHLLVSNLGNAGHHLVSGGIKFFNSIFNLFLIFVLSFYMLLELDNIKLFFIQITNSSNLKYFSDLLEQINKCLSRYIRGQGIICLSLCVFYSFSLFMISLQFGLLLGIFSGFICFVPYIGAFLGCLISIIIGFLQFGFNLEILYIILIFLAGQLFESYYLTPKFVGEAVNLNPLWIIFSLSLGAKFFGFLGVLIAIPLAAIFGVVLRFYFKLVFYK